MATECLARCERISHPTHPSLVERSYGTFARSFTLPDDADAEKVNAEFKDGVLLVHVTKSEKSKPKQIDVKVS